MATSTTTTTTATTQEPTAALPLKTTTSTDEGAALVAALIDATEGNQRGTLKWRRGPAFFEASKTGGSPKARFRVAYACGSVRSGTNKAAKKREAGTFNLWSSASALEDAAEGTAKVFTKSVVDHFSGLKRLVVVAFAPHPEEADTVCVGGTVFTKPMGSDFDDFDYNAHVCTAFRRMMAYPILVSGVNPAVDDEDTIRETIMDQVIVWGSAILMPSNPIVCKATMGDGRAIENALLKSNYKVVPTVVGINVFDNVHWRKRKAA